MTYRVGAVDEENFGPTIEKDDSGSEGQIDPQEGRLVPKSDQSQREDQTPKGRLVPRGWSVLTRDDPLKDRQARPII